VVEGVDFSASSFFMQMDENSEVQSYGKGNENSKDRVLFRGNQP
jgi:hypothetical protein